MITSTKDKILQYISSRNGTRVIDITSNFKISPQIVHRHLSNLAGQNLIRKIGSSPKVCYLPASRDSVITETATTPNKKLIQDIIDENINETVTVISL
jgi:DeoR/GlpR family transcriptional regulator of sugar metabolism